MMQPMNNWTTERSILSFEMREYHDLIERVRDPRTGPFERRHLVEVIEAKERAIAKAIIQAQGESAMDFYNGIGEELAGG